MMEMQFIKLHLAVMENGGLCRPPHPCPLARKTEGGGVLP